MKNYENVVDVTHGYNLIEEKRSNKKVGLLIMGTRDSISISRFCVCF